MLNLLLIVPYGIETPRYASILLLLILLIVPYGIETVSIADNTAIVISRF